jgi:ABC-type transport system involved in cytochrome bd biosynthesis fused ATPase/permease subunit
VLLVWPAAVGVGVAFFAWWKAIGLVVAAFLLLVPALGALTPRAMSAHYLAAIRADLEQRLAAGSTDAAELRQILARLAHRGAPAG